MIVIPPGKPRHFLFSAQDQEEISPRNGPLDGGGRDLKRDFQRKHSKGDDAPSI